MATKTLKVRVKDKHAKQLSAMAVSVNQVWNYINALSERSIRERGKFLSAFDFHQYTVGASKELGLHSSTPQCVAKEYTTRRKQFKKSRLAWRKSFGSRRSLGWVPVNTGASKWKEGKVYHNGSLFDVWDSYGLEQYKFRSASFNEDARGRWYFNVVVEFQPEQSTGTKDVGIDLGCKDSATTSDGEKMSGRWYREQEQKLAIAQRANKKQRVKAIHAKVANRRKDEMHKFSRKLVNENAAIYVGNVSSKAMVKTKLAKSTLDAGWGMFKTMLEYKCDHAGVVFEVVNEAYSTQACSGCGSIAGPRGRAGLNERDWECSECGAQHDRDINAALNIRAAGRCRLAGGTSHEAA